MTKDEALKLALEALEDLGMKHFESTGEVLYKDTFTAIKEALAQQETPNEIGKRVAREGGGLSSLWSAVSHDSDLPEAQRGYEEALAQPEPEYVAFMDVPQRTWVGLTDEEITEEMPVTGHRPITSFARAIEAKLKEKNT